MIGKKFNDWFVIGLSKKTDSARSKYFECRCKCGNLKVVRGTDLKNGRAKKCPDCIYKSRQDMEGREFGKWKVLNYIKIDKPGKHYECMCECGTIKIIPGTTLRAGKSKQCTRCQYNNLYDIEKEVGKYYGKWQIIRFVDKYKNTFKVESECRCGRRAIHFINDLRAKKTTQCLHCHNKQAATKHGMHNTTIYYVWSSMKDRCNNPKSTAYKWYGGRGIKVCKRWGKFERFLEDMGERPKGMTIDRIDNDGDYCKENCRWISHQENCRNRKKRRL